jgi:predicted RNase H-like HicB family nuclease
MAYYVGLIHREPKSDFGVSFPDLPGCITAGRTLQEASLMAREALALHLEGLRAEGMEIPEPSTVDAVMEDPRLRALVREGVVILVPAPAREEKTLRVNVTLPAGLVQRIDDATDNRSRFLAEAAEEKLRAGPAPIERPRRKRA